ncbi:MAG: hypothetical protein ACYDBB_12490 [Armatimonadota bacterium]
MMMLDSVRWDPSQPGFIVAVLRTLVGLWLLVSLLGLLLFRSGFWGLFTGGLAAVALYAIAILTGKIFTQTSRFTGTLFWLLMLQFGVWIGIAVLLAVAKVHPLGFVIGVSILPIAIIITLIWYHVQRKRTSS